MKNLTIHENSISISLLNAQNIKIFQVNKRIEDNGHINFEITDGIVLCKVDAKIATEAFNKVLTFIDNNSWK